MLQATSIYFAPEPEKPEAILSFTFDLDTSHSAGCAINFSADNRTQVISKREARALLEFLRNYIDNGREVTEEG